MPRKPDQVTYVAQVARVRIETAVVKIKADASKAEDAIAKAIVRAKQLPAAAWTMEPYDPNSYRPHVQEIATQDELEEDRQRGGPASDEELIDAREHTRYLLLTANSETAEGDVILQPWLVVDQPDLLASDLCREWIAALQSLGLTHMSERLDDLAAGGRPRPSDRVMFAAKSRRKPRS
jgi:hypothetical protein